MPNKISCSVRGGIDILGKLEKEQFRNSIHKFHDRYNEIDFSSVHLKPRIKEHVEKQIVLNVYICKKIVPLFNMEYFRLWAIDHEKN